VRENYGKRALAPDVPEPVSVVSAMPVALGER
jgi:hypothetical protein